MIPVHDASSEPDARAVVSLLEAHMIPALLDLDVEGAILPWRRISDQRVIEVLVPSSMVSKATEVLHRHDYSTIGSHGRPRFRIRFATSVAVPAPKPEPQAFEARPTSEIGNDEEDTGPLELPLPAAAHPLNARMLAALGAIGIGAALQRVLESTFGQREVVVRFAAKAPITEEPWRLVTAGFLHGSLSHFLSNGFFALLIGVVLFGTHLVGATALVWTVSSIFGLAAESTLSTGALVLGASAGNYGLVGLWASGQMQRARSSLLPRRERIRTIGILLLLVPGALTPFSSTGTKVAVIAHVVGFLVGLLMGFGFERRLAPMRFNRIHTRSRWAMVAALAIVGLGFLFGGLSLF